MTNTPDITYTKGDMFTTFKPWTPEGVTVFNQICNAQGDCTGKVLNIHLQSTLLQLRSAGYTVRTNSKRLQAGLECTLPVMSDDELLLSLGQ